MAPAVSVLLPVYNGAQYLAASIESILAQTFDDFEFIIVDDGSTDQSPAIIADFAAADQRIRPIYLPTNQGACAAINSGFENCQGEYIAHIDHDDVAEPDRLRHQVLFLGEHREIGLLASTMTVIDESGNPTGFYWAPRDHDHLAFAMLFNNPVPHSSVMFRALLIRDHHLRFNAAFAGAEDYAFWSAMLTHTRAFALREPLVRYRLHSDQMSRTGADRTRAVADQISAANLRQLAIDPPPWTERQELYQLTRFLVAAHLGEADRAETRGATPAQLEQLRVLLNTYLNSTGSTDALLHRIRALLPNPL